MSNNIHDIKGANEFDAKLKETEDKFVLIDFWAEWCGPCKAAEPVIEKLSESLKSQMTVLKVNVDENRELAGRYGVMSIPTMFMYVPKQEDGAETKDGQMLADDEFNGRQFSVAVGFRPEPAMMQWFEAVGIDPDAADE